MNKLNEYRIYKVKDIKLGVILQDVRETEMDRMVKRERERERERGTELLTILSISSSRTSCNIIPNFISLTL